MKRPNQVEFHKILIGRDGRARTLCPNDPAGNI